MDAREEEFLRRLRSTFRVEAEEHLRAMSSAFIELEKDPDAPDAPAVLEKVYRSAHSLKGASRAVNLREIESVCQSLESVLSMLKNQELRLSQDVFDTFDRAVDAMFRLAALEQAPHVADLIEELHRLATGESAPQKAVQTTDHSSVPKPHNQLPRTTTSEKSEQIQDLSKPEPSLPELHYSLPSGKNPADLEHQMRESVSSQLLESSTVRISTAKLDELLYQVEEMVSVKMASNQRVVDLRDISVLMESWKKAWRKVASEASGAKTTITARSSADSAVHASRIMEFLDWNNEYMKTLESKMSTLTRGSENESRQLGGMVDDLLEDMKNLLMLPFSTLLEIFPKIVRDLARDKNKHVKFVVEGTDIEIDRRILEEMKDPLIHLVRNSLDHGIEDPDARTQKNKPSHGTLSITIAQSSSNRIEISVQDDGTGMDPRSIKQAAVYRGILTQSDAEALSDKEALSLIFRSEVSTSPIITDLSGRGLGLAIVQEKVDKLGGKIRVDTTPDVGTSFWISLPVTLATFRGILIEAGGQVFVIPTSNVRRVLRLNRETIKTVENRRTIPLDGKVVLFVRLEDILEIPPTSNCEDSHLVHTVILGTGRSRVAFGVDNLLSEQEVIVKNLGKQLSRVRNVSGATVLASGRVVPILNVSDMMKSAAKFSVLRTRVLREADDTEKGPKRILVAEDSITSRMLLKNILESAGYEVQTTVDGSEAWTALKTEHFDIVVSDVQMPAIDGFELTSKIRSDKQLNELPVVLVTSLESREDREKGIDVGANAYIIKSSFDQSNLLEVVRRLT